MFNWQRFFPFSEPRIEQSRAIDFILNAFLNEGKKYVICDCETGVGKSAIGWTVSQFLNSYATQQNLNFNCGSWFLTTQKILQEQYLRDFPTLKSIKSSTSYICSVHEGEENALTCGEVHRLMAANPIFKKIYCMCVGDCKYRVDKRNFLESLNSITNYSYFFAESQYAGHIKPRNLLVCDEAHVIQNQLSSHVEITISERFAKQQLDIEMPNDFKDVNDAFNWLQKKYLRSLKACVAKHAKILEEMGDVQKKIKSFADYAKKHDMLDKHMCKVNRLIKHFSPENWVFNVVPPSGKSQRKLEFKPVDVSPFAYDHLFSFGEKVLMMSATILDKRVFCRQLGISLDNVAYIKIPTPFKASNRPIHIMSIGSMSKNCIDQTLPKMAQAVKVILDQHKNDKGIVHCTSSKVSNYLVDNIADPRLITHDSLNRNLILQLHEETTKPSVLVSPSMAEGVDLSDDKSRFQIICKIPFPYLGDKVIQKRMQLDKEWYKYMTVMTIIQMVGRSVRNENDYAMTYILDADWHKLYASTRQMFPQAFKDALK